MPNITQGEVCAPGGYLIDTYEEYPSSLCVTDSDTGDLVPDVAVTETTQNSEKMQVSTTDAASVSYTAKVAVLSSNNDTPELGCVGDDLPEGGDTAVHITARRPAGMHDEAIRGERNGLKVEAIQEEEVETLGYQPFPVDLLPEPLRGYVKANAAAIGCDPVFIALPLLAALASAVGNSRRVELKRRWTEPAILWAIVVAPSGGHKSPGFDAAMLPIRKRQETAKQQFHDGDTLTWERCWTDDTTLPALASLLLDNPRGLLLSCDELSAWFGSFDRSTKSGTKSCGDTARWLHIHGGRALVIDRKTGKPRTVYVPNATVSVAGGIQPGVLRLTLSREHQESGMAARFLFAMPPKRQKRWTESEIDETVEAAVLTIFDRLFALRPDTNDKGESTPRLVKLSAKAKSDYWIPYVNALGKERAGLDDTLAATSSKLEGYAARLALVHYLIRCAANDPTADNPDALDETSMAAGIALSRWFGKEAERVFAMLSESDDHRKNRELLELVEGWGGSVTANQLRRNTRKFRTSDEAEVALQKLVKLGQGDWRPNPISVRGGRPTRTFILRDAVKTILKSKENEGTGEARGTGHASRQNQICAGSGH